LNSHVISRDCHSTIPWLPFNCLSFFLCGRAFSFLFLFPLNCAALVLECKWNWINVSTELLQFQFFCDVRSKGNTEDFPFPPSLLEEKWDFHENALCCICHQYNYSVDKDLEGEKGFEEKHWKECTLLHPFKIDLNREQIIREAFFSTKIIQERSPYDLYVCLCACVCVRTHKIIIAWVPGACDCIFMRVHSCVCFLLQGGITFAFTAVLSRLYKNWVCREPSCNYGLQFKRHTKQPDWQHNHANTDSHYLVNFCAVVFRDCFVHVKNIASVLAWERGVKTQAHIERILMCQQNTQHAHTRLQAIR